jgi:hypothetical protein
MQASTDQIFNHFPLSKFSAAQRCFKTRFYAGKTLLAAVTCQGLQEMGQVGRARIPEFARRHPRVFTDAHRGLAWVFVDETNTGTPKQA